MKKIATYATVILFSSMLHSAQDRPKFTKQQSQEVARKVRTCIDMDEGSEKAFSKALYSSPKHEEIHEHRTKMVRCAESLEDEEKPSDEIKSELASWAIRELAHRAENESAEKKRQERYKLIASGIAGIATIVSVVVPLVTSCDPCSGDAGSNG